MSLHVLESDPSFYFVGNISQLLEFDVEHESFGQRLLQGVDHWQEVRANDHQLFPRTVLWIASIVTIITCLYCFQLRTSHTYSNIVKYDYLKLLLSLLRSMVMSTI